MHGAFVFSPGWRRSWVAEDLDLYVQLEEGLPWTLDSPWEEAVGVMN
jgi:hypothetical protein